MITRAPVRDLTRALRSSKVCALWPPAGDPDRQPERRPAQAAPGTCR
jgi:hypothetical protein